ncbi:hypothetical protein DQ397_000779 [Pseudomonas sp. CK-NBRI-02]|nr:hypothetical protein DQ397_000779 [Pseudomonas sp. CK-NBRI-02]
MGILAEMALRRARGRLNSVQSRAAAKAPVKAEVGPTSSEVVVTGPINRFMFLEGRSWAVDMVASLRASPVTEVIERLVGAAADRPGSYAAGIRSVVQELQAGS